jgi:hypothetical protein
MVKIKQKIYSLKNKKIITVANEKKKKFLKNYFILKLNEREKFVLKKNQVSKKNKTWFLLLFLFYSEQKKRFNRN